MSCLHALSRPGTSRRYRSDVFLLCTRAEECENRSGHEMLRQRADVPRELLLALLLQRQEAINLVEEILGWSAVELREERRPQNQKPFQ